MICKSIDTEQTPRGEKLTYHFRQDNYYMSISYAPTYDSKSGQILYKESNTFRIIGTDERKIKEHKELLINTSIFTVGQEYSLLYSYFSREMLITTITEQFKQQSTKQVIKPSKKENYIYIGTTDEVNFCQCCGKSNLKKVIILQNINTKEYLFVGSECQYKYIKR